MDQTGQVAASYLARLSYAFRPVVLAIKQLFPKSKQFGFRRGERPGEGRLLSYTSRPAVLAETRGNFVKNGIFTKFRYAVHRRPGD